MRIGLRIKIATVISALSLGVVSVWQFYRLDDGRRRNEQIRWCEFKKEVETAVTQVERLLRGLEALNEELVVFVQEENPTDDELEMKLKSLVDIGIEEDLGLFGMGVAFDPELREDKNTYGPYWTRDGPKPLHNDPERDYRLEPFYSIPVKEEKGVWQEPHYGPASGARIANFTSPICERDDAGVCEKDKAGRPTGVTLGVAFTALTLRDYRAKLHELDLSRWGYAFLVSRNLRFISHPDREQLDSKFKALESSHVIDGSDPDCSLPPPAWTNVDGRKALKLLKPIPLSGWQLGVVAYKNDLLAGISPSIHGASLVLAPLGCLLSISLLWYWRVRSRAWAAPALITVVTLALAVALVATIAMGSASQAETPGARILSDLSELRMQSRAAIRRAQEKSGLEKGTVTRVPLGLTLHSLNFVGPNDVHLTGLIRERLAGAKSPDAARPSFVFPEAVEVSFQKAYVVSVPPDVSIVAWQFSAVVRQSFDYSRYPLDNKHVWLRMRGRDPEAALLFEPDLASYERLPPSTLPGIEPSLLPGGWNLESSLFTYVDHPPAVDYETPEETLGVFLPELYFNVHLKRKWLRGGLTYGIPLAVITVLVFASFLAFGSSDGSEEPPKFGSALAVVSSLFFASMLAHGRVRATSPESLVFMDYPYFLAYGGLLAVSGCAFFLSRKEPKRSVVLLTRTVRLLYWPIYASLLLVVAYRVF